MFRLRILLSQKKFIIFADIAQLQIEKIRREHLAGEQ